MFMMRLVFVSDIFLYMFAIRESASVSCAFSYLSYANPFLCFPQLSCVKFNCIKYN